MSWADAIYRRISGDRNGASAKGIEEAAVENVPHNFVVQVIASVATKAGDQLFSPRLMLTWIMSSIGAPLAAISLIVPIRESLALLPQLTAAAIMRCYAIRKWFFVGGAVAQALSILLIIGVALTLEGALAGWLMLALLAVFSLGRVFQSITSKDISGKTLPKQRRGLAGGTASAIAGGASILVALYFIFLDQNAASLDALSAVLAAAAVLWLLGAACYGQLHELPSEVEDPDAGLGDQLKRSWQELQANQNFRTFILVRTGLIGNALALPMIIMLVFEDGQGAARSLGILMAGGGLAALVSSFIWGKWADRSSRKVLITVGYLGGGLALAASLLMHLDSSTLRTGLVILAFFGLAVIHQGTRLGRKTYIIDLADADNRTTLVALANTMIGVNLMIIGSISSALAAADFQWAITFCAACSLGGGIIAHRLPEVEED